MRTRTLLSLVLISLLVSGCLGVQGAWAVVKAEATDYISHTEERNNGSFVIWLRYDEAGNYCTFDHDLFEQAQQFRKSGQKVTVSYETIDFGDRDGAFLGSGCDAEAEGYQTYRLTGIHPAAE